MDRSNQESKRELLDPTSEHSTAIWDQQGRPVAGIIIPKSGHAIAYVERFVCVILRRLGPFALRTGKKTLRLVYILFCVRFMCIVYIAYMATVVLIVKISFIRFAHCVDSEDKLYTFCTLCLRLLFTFHIYLNTISFQVAANQITWARKGHNLLFVNFTFLCYVLKEKTSEEGESRKASGKQIMLMVNSQHIYTVCSGLDNMGPKRAQSFIRIFYIFMSFFFK